MKLICVLVFAYAKSQFSHDEAPFAVVIVGPTMTTCFFLVSISSCEVNIVLLMLVIHFYFTIGQGFEKKMIMARFKDDGV